MKEDDQRLLDEARRSREATEELREGGSEDEPDEGREEDEAGNPWAKTSSGDADSVTEDD